MIHPIRHILRRLPLAPALATVLATAALPVHATPSAPAAAAPEAPSSDASAPAAAALPSADDRSDGAAAAPSPRTLAEANSRPRRGAGAAPTDGSIVEEITGRLAGDPRLEDADIRVEAKDGSVVLTGRSPTDEGRQAAEEVAMQVDGVTQVDNRISSPSSATTIGERSRDTLKRTEEVASDSWITTKIRGAILADPLTRSSSGNIDIKTIDGVVTLVGSVATQAELDRVIKIAHEIKGVKQVNTNGLQAGREQ